MAESAAHADANAGCAATMSEPETGAAAGVRSYRVRYATAQRFAPPRPARESAGQSMGQLCPQLPGRLAPVMGEPKTALPQGEDCLNLAITAPSHGSRWPVIVFLHGGAFVSGGGLLDWYDGSALSAEAGIVVISVNYRLGALGYLCLEGVCEGNLGLLDQLEALRCVRDNIEGYGGDPANVTVCGQSAGAVSIRLLMQIPAAQGLFHRAILQSGPGADLARSRESAEAVGRLFADLLGADPRSAPVATLLDAQRRTTAVLMKGGDVAVPAFYPTSGTGVLPSTGHALGEHVRGMDVICGWNADDVSAFTGPGPDVAAATDRILAVPIDALVKQLHAAGAHASTYRFDWRPTGSPFGATHCVELPLLFGTQLAWEPCPMLGETPWEEFERLGRALRRIWGYFAHTGEVPAALAGGLPLQWNPPPASGG